MHMKNDEHWKHISKIIPNIVSQYISVGFFVMISLPSLQAPSIAHHAAQVPKTAPMARPRKKVMQLQSIFHVHPFGQVVQRQSHNDRLSEVKHVGKLLESLVVGQLKSHEKKVYRQMACIQSTCHLRHGNCTVTPILHKASESQVGKSTATVSTCRPEPTY